MTPVYRNGPPMPLELRIRAFAMGIRVFGQHVSGDFHHPDPRMREIEWHEEIRRVPWDRDLREATP